ncbi:hypothetical protein AB0C04_14810 [Micromonospora sp. NPDC048909]|uniref:hypothetical protein n=1 Tax=Micromonospora sp. NPDC048909 TaxID=3155643 RepID=UPI0033C0B2C1
MIDREETLVRRLLADAAEDLPAGGMPTDALLAEGERAVRRRQRRLVGAAAAATVVALLGAAVLLQGVRPQAQRSPAEQPSPSATATGGPPTVAPDQFDPAQRLFRLDWLPEGMSIRHESYERYGQWVTVMKPQQTQKGAPSIGLEDIVTVMINAAGADPFANWAESDALTGGGRVAATPLPGVPVAPVWGEPAYLHTSPDGRETRLSWQYAPDAWAAVSVREMERPEEIARRIADGLIWDRQPVTLPFLPVAPPEGATLHRAVVTVRDGRWENAQLGYLAPSRPEVRSAVEDFTVGMTREFRGKVAGSTTVHGRQGWVDAMPSGIGVYRVGELPGVCQTCMGEVSALSSAGLQALGGRDGALALSATIRTVDDPADMTTWRPL